MRVIAGTSRGLKLLSQDGTDTRPTLDRVKEAMFSMIMPYIQDSVVLDAFAGSGALGIEALSRGAKKAFFADINAGAVRCIESNVKNAKRADSCVILNTDILAYLKRCDVVFDIILLDPPYNSGLYLPCTTMIYENGLLSENGIIVIEWDFENGVPDLDSHFISIKEKKYGRVGVSILKRG